MYNRAEGSTTMVPKTVQRVVVVGATMVLMAWMFVMGVAVGVGL